MTSERCHQNKTRGCLRTDVSHFRCSECYDHDLFESICSYVSTVLEGKLVCYLSHQLSSLRNGGGNGYDDDDDDDDDEEELLRELDRIKKERAQEAARKVCLRSRMCRCVIAGVLCFCSRSDFRCSCHCLRPSGT